jgi:sugar phosphate isomerase/epimerase
MTNKLAVFPKGFFDKLVAREMSLPTWLDHAASLEIDGVELYPKFFESLDAPYIAGVRRALETRGLEMPMMCNSPDFTQSDPDARAAEVAKTRRMIEVTAELGGKWCRVLSGQNRPGLDEETTMGWVTGCLETLVPFAERAGIVMAIENHYKDGLWTYPEWAQSTKRYLTILDRVQSPWLAAQYDPSNAIVAGEDAYALLEQVLPRMATMQASDRYLQGGSLSDLRGMDRDPQHGYAKFIKHGVIGNGLNDYDRIFGILSRSGYKGWISIEDGDGDTVEEGMSNLRASVAFLKQKLAQFMGGK